MIASALVGSLGRGDYDDWSDVDLLVVVPDHLVETFSLTERLPAGDRVTVAFDARHNSPRGTGARSGQYLVHELPLWVDWYIYPAAQAGWVTDSRAVFERVGLPRWSVSFDAHLASRQTQPATPKPANAHRLLQISLIPVAGKRIARRSADTARMVEFLGGSTRPDVGEPSFGEYLEELRRLIAVYRNDGPPESLDAAARYLDIVEAAL